MISGSQVSAAKGTVTLRARVILLKVIGSSRYISPEVLTKNAPANPSMDVWALGIMLYKMLLGSYPFDADTRKEIFEKVRKGEYSFDKQLVTGVSCAAIGLIISMLQVDPDKRIKTVDISNHPWITTDIDSM